MELNWITTPLTELQTDALIVPLLADVAPNRIRGFSPEFAELLAQLNHHGDWKGDKNEVAIFYPDAAHSPVASRFPGLKRVIFAGMGKKADWDYEKMRGAVASALQVVKKRKISECTVFLPETTIPATIRDLATITLLATYEFNQYQSKEGTEKPAALDSVRFLAFTQTIDLPFERAVKAGQLVGEATVFVRDLTNQPANVLTPKRLADEARRLGNDRIKVTVLGVKDIEKLKMGSFLSVAKGSTEEAQLVVAEYNPKSTLGPIPTIALVGKGITFDAGGISIKPAAKMDEMKMDMAGAATCLGVLRAAEALKLPMRLVAVLPMTENLPSGHASRPGDIVRAYNGKTIEILNTDAEGRLILADALSYAAATFKPDAIIDLATLTGATLVVLGHEATSMLGNNDELMTKVDEASKRTGEKVWQMPLWDEYKEHIKSDIADIKNLGEAGHAGVSAGAAFLSHFVPKETPWVHLDISGTAMLDKARRPYLGKGGSGWGVRLLVDLLEHWQ